MYNRIENQAISILKELDINTLPIPIEDIAKRRGVQIKPYDLGEDVSGVLLIDKDKSVIGYNPTESVVRQRFTIAHELGHFELHRKYSELFVDKDKPLFRNQDSSTGEFKREKEANAFAAAILMPEHLIQKVANNLGLNFIDEVAIKQLAKIFNVSQQAMTIRLTKLNLFW
ncbi:ImmA/IrrE family metallo-endopeptidase [Rufibacter quisquiliarum]|uniref:Zn-dependent peptidase ImmA (M78 family) n=1 Tax=Rufibacter quisquiliarum TaxID=1549639 RepID=A0A839GQB4_9BACT|nr:ImmA/IrrE family metallo-endopeptidase [Rufibacter quisquiliarum]MBA9077087.1 Zn-dependent peptidase ImmA (M78 family) [Rufibacter quisquiliarum]